MRYAIACTVLLAAAPAFAGLALEVEVPKAEIGFEETVEYVVRFVNRGEDAVSYLEPVFAGRVSFPDIRIVLKSDGRELRPYDQPFQSSAGRGPSGATIRLGPGEKKEYRYSRQRFMAVDRNSQKADWHEPRPLPDGEYEIRADFTGGIKAEPATFRVLPPTKPHVRITVPDRERAVLRIVFANPGASAHVFEGSPVLRLSSKMYGGATARPELHASPLAVPPGARREFTVDLRALNWIREGGSDGPEGLGEIVPSGIVWLSFELNKGDKVAFFDWIWASVPKAPARGLDNVVVSAALSKARVRVGDPVRLTAGVENLGGADVAFVHRLSFPRELLIRIQDASGERRLIGAVTWPANSKRGMRRMRGMDLCRVPEGLSWAGERFDPAPGLTRKDLIWVEPKAGIEKTVELTALLAKGFTPGRYRISAGYRNTESGLRLGFTPGHLAATGVVWSAPVELTVE